MFLLFNHSKINPPPLLQGHIDYMEKEMIGRLAKPEEVANLCVYLASDEVSHPVLCGEDSYCGHDETEVLQVFFYFMHFFL